MAEVGPTMETEAQRLQAALARLAAEGAAGVRIADATVAIWHGVDSGLSPIIGPRAIAALFQRSLFLTRREHLWLATVVESAAWPAQLDALYAALSKQSGDAAATASGALLRAFSDLLGTLIGVSLTERLLASIRDHLSGHAAQDASP